jgi:HemX protein
MIFASAALLVVELSVDSVWRERFPLETLRDSALVFSLILLASVFVAERAANSRIPALVMVPFAMALQCVALFFDRWFATGEARQGLGNTLMTIHIVLFLFSYAAFLVAAAFSVLFLLLDRRLKSRDITPALKHAPGLAGLDQLAHRAAGLGLLLLTLAAGLSFALLARLPEIAGPAVPAARGIAGDLTVWSTAILWAYYAVYLALRDRMGWVGKRACYAILTGLVLVVVFYFAGKVLPGGSLHGFALPETGTEVRH